jgi:HK97 family phage major capsid protein
MTTRHRHRRYACVLIIESEHKVNPYRGQCAVRTIKALGVAKGSVPAAIAYAQSQGWPNTPDIVESIRAAAVTGTGTDDVARPTPAAFDFAEFLRPQTVIGKLVGLRRVPARVRLIAATAGSSAYWSGERNPRPISKLTLAGSTLELLSVVAQLVTTRELLRSSAPSAESILSRDLGGASAQAVDEAFLDPLNAGVANVKPAAITNGAPVVHSSGGTLAQIDADLQILVNALHAAGSDLNFATWILRPRTALYLAGIRGSGGAPAFPQLGVKGGVLLGLPAITSSASLSDVGSPTEGGEITLLDPSQILVADDGGSGLEISEQSAIAMADNPTAPSTLVSMWQTESALLRISRHVNWARTRPGMVQVLDQVTY